MYPLDTNVVSELRRARPHGALLAWIAPLPDRDLHISAMTVGEIQRGIELTRPRDGQRADKIERWLQRIVASMDVIPMNWQVMQTWARLMHRRSYDLYEDAIIAATALVHDLTVATRDVADFAGFGVRLVNPFEPAP